ncbi:MAG: MoxR family ATPase [Clostridia bacterium]|nr:MoxR family ATPase [Clostridia bacterium]
MEIKQVSGLASGICDSIGQVIFGKKREIRLIVTSMLAGGHVLLDDIPGTGKTTLARALAASISGESARIQFTPDLLPSDITGINYFNQKMGEFVFRPGPVFTNILIADEINRTTPRTQSALLECMGERQITVDGVTYPAGKPFMVIATQNPVESQGTFPLPEAQTDRFLMKLSVGYPGREGELRMMNDHSERSPLEKLAPVCSCDDIVDACESVKSVFVSDSVKDYILRIVTETRESSRVTLGISPRGTLALMYAARAYAASEGREYVIPDDIKALAVPVLAHRIIAHAQSTLRVGDTNSKIIEYIIDTVKAPTGD